MQAPRVWPRGAVSQRDQLRVIAKSAEVPGSHHGAPASENNDSEAARALMPIDTAEEKNILPSPTWADGCLWMRQPCTLDLYARNAR
jgi:hypothetical protein